MTLKQRALLNTVLTVAGVLACGVAGAFVSTFMTPAMFSALMAVIMLGFFCYLVYTWNVTSLEMDERFNKMRDNK
jgi:NAD/NADP transhydrogenase beta subunit